MKLFAKPSPNALRMLLAGLLSLSLMSCSGARPRVNTAVQPVLIPDPPAYLRAVRVPDPKVGDDPLLIAGKYRQGLQSCNVRVTNGRADWQALQSFYAQPVKSK